MDMRSVVDIGANPNIAEFGHGDTVRVSFRVVESGRERTQAFNGIVIRIRRGGAGASFTVRQIFHGVGVERTFPYHSPLMEKVEVVKHAHVRRAKLYYLRGLSKKKTRQKMKSR
ncbi:MAG: 50S ribosomal protein L19 [Dehalococcoidia bacterium]|nr:50S ribosomal protein L19 [Chloroflexota bacterium]MBT9161078.1 50S ribosomal protein L19 [Chloroflexota bacterium]MBT9162538.1 50S ribosomal protein L19 [Chloroflexota bacterium]